MVYWYVSTLPASWADTAYITCEMYDIGIRKDDNIIYHVCAVYTSY